MISFEQFRNNQYQDRIVVVDRLVASLHGIDVPNMLLIDGGECAKSWDNVMMICQWLMLLNVDKHTQVVAIGGGSIGDVVGLACSIYKRGIPLLHIPTTLLAMIDSSIGGKTAINMNGAKNIIGTIHTADTLVDSRFLSTLPIEHCDSGMGEVYKYMLLSRDIWHCDTSDIDNVILLCAQYKQSIVAQDPLDNMGIRIGLNMGHTIAHGLELAHGIAHGQAVAVGCHYALDISLALQLVDRQYYDMWHSRAVYQHIDITLEDIDSMLYDKKNSDNLITLVLPTNGWGFVVRQFDKIQLATLLGVTC